MIWRRFSRLVLQEDDGPVSTTNRYVKVVCDCGTIKKVRLDHLISGATRSCLVAAIHRNKYIKENK